MDDIVFDNRTTFVGVDIRKVNFRLAALLEEMAHTELRIQHLWRRNPLMAWCLSITCDFGRSFVRYLGTSLLLTSVFTFFYYFVPSSINNHTVWDCFEMSASAFLKITPREVFPITRLGKSLFIAEAGIGYIMLSVLVAMIIRRTIGR